MRVESDARLDCQTAIAPAFAPPELRLASRTTTKAASRSLGEGGRTCVIDRILWLAPGTPSSHLAVRPLKGARNAGSHRTRGLQDLAILKRSLVVERDSAETSAFRARCWRLAPWPPRWTYVVAPPLWGMQGNRRHDPKPRRLLSPVVRPAGEPGNHGLGRRAVGCACCTRDAATASPRRFPSVAPGPGAVVGASHPDGPASRRLMKRPSDGPDRLHIVLVGIYVNSKTGNPGGNLFAPPAMKGPAPSRALLR